MYVEYPLEYFNETSHMCIYLVKGVLHVRAVQDGQLSHHSFWNYPPVFALLNFREV